MSHRLGTLAAVVGIISFSLLSDLRIYGQAPTNERPEASPLRQNAIILLESTIDELGAVEDVDARVNFAADILGLLGGIRPQRCRQMLDDLFDDVMKLKRAHGTQSNTRQPSPDALLRRLIQAAASFDRKLARSYIDRYTEEASAQRSEPSSPARPSPAQADLNMLLALQLVETDPGLAVRIAERAVATGVTGRTLEFLGTLRKKDPRLADGFFAAALQSVRARQGTDANELLLLYAYVFSPTRVPWLTTQGIVQRQIPGYQQVAQAYPVDARLAQQFLRASAQILLTGVQNRYANPDAGGGAAGDLYLINLIKPLAAQYTPQLFGPLSEQGNLLVSYLQPEQYTRLQSDVDRLNRLHNSAGKGADNNAAGVESLLSRADGLPPSAKRDYLYYTAASTAVREKQYDSALEIAERVSPESRARIKEFIGFSIAQQSVSDHQLERAEQWAQRDTDLTRRAYLCTLVASALLDDESKDYARATKFLVEAEQLASKLDTTREGISILFRGAEIYSRFDKPRASETLRLAFKATNKEEGFTENGKVSRRLEVGDFSFHYEMFNDNLSLSRTLGQLAHSDFYGSLSAIRELRNRALRLRALISLCSGVLTGHPERAPESRVVGRTKFVEDVFGAAA